MKAAPLAQLGLYVHWPYCARICPYCDFNVRRDRGQDTDFLVDAIVADIIGWAAKMDHPRALTSISFGGGTPSRLNPAQMKKILTAAQSSFGLDPAIEISLEANPTDMEAAKYREFVAIGVNRLSLGLQSLLDHDLQFLGRDHNASEGLRALDLARTVFDQISADFIYALPEQTPDTWDTDLSRIMALGLSHLSLYCLGIEPCTSFANRQKRGQLITPDDDHTADLYELTQTRCTEAGLPSYETSNHARHIHNRSRHNLLYWQGEDWIGVGPGAHGRVQIDGKRFALAAYKKPEHYANAVQATGWGVMEEEPLTPKNDLVERLMLGLRLTDGIDLDLMQKRAGICLDPKRLEQACRDNYIRLENGKLIALFPMLVDRIAGQLL